jgi:hypothetical protein
MPAPTQATALNVKATSDAAADPQRRVNRKPPPGRLRPSPTVLARGERRRSVGNSATTCRPTKARLVRRCRARDTGPIPKGRNGINGDRG